MNIQNVVLAIIYHAIFINISAIKLNFVLLVGKTRFGNMYVRLQNIDTIFSNNIIKTNNGM